MGVTSAWAGALRAAWWAGVRPSFLLPRDQQHQIRFLALIQWGGRKLLFVADQKENNWHGDS